MEKALSSQTERMREDGAGQAGRQRGVATASVLDRRPAALSQGLLQASADRGPRTAQLSALQQMVDASPRMVHQRDARDDMLPASRSNKTGLPDALKTGIESLSGMSMDHVKVHYGSAMPAQLHAHAYAQGSDIHLAPGQERHLPHEAWHVVQQAQGRVKPTMQMKQGTLVNDDAGLEAEADAMGARALAGGAPTLQRAPAPAGMFVAAPGDAPVQCKMGFEFETDYTFDIWKGNKWAPVGRDKGHPFYKGDGFVIEGDTHDNCEFIFDPVDSKEEAVKAAQAARKLTTALDHGFDNAGLVTKDVGGNWLRKTRIKNRDNAWAADAQVTQGVRLADLPHYISDHLNRKQLAAHATQIATAGMAPQLAAEVRGLVELIIKFVADFQKWDGKDADEGPKNAQVWMARTKYVEMAKALGAERANFKNLFFSGSAWKADNPVSKATGVLGDKPLIPKKYLDSSEHKISSTTTLKQWMTELCAGGAKDAMSPPKGWAGNYGMGLLGMDTASAVDPLVLLEYRKTDNLDDADETSGKDLPAAMWETYVEEQFDKALVWNGTLQDQVPEEPPDLASLFPDLG
jgi:hypothetical protein